MQVDFKQLADDLLRDAKNVLDRWFPQGKFRGKEFLIGNLSGDVGESLSINWKTGKWKDFSSGDTGGDLISLYAAIHGLEQIEAAKQLGAPPLSSDSGKKPTKPKTETPARVVIMPAPNSHDCKHKIYGMPTHVWTYLSSAGELLGYVARYDPAGERKQIVPWTFSSDGWGMGQWSVPRPLYGLELLEQFPEKPIMLVEGEKAADAARAFCGRVYNVLTWSGGAQAVGMVDWSPLYGRKILLWPDADRKVVKTPAEAEKYVLAIGDVIHNELQPGYSAMVRVSGLLKDHCDEIKIINVGIDLDRVDGWDAYDAFYIDEWSWQDFKTWAIPRVILFAKELPPDTSASSSTDEPAYITEVPPIVDISTKAKAPPAHKKPNLTVVASGGAAAQKKLKPQEVTAYWEALPWAKHVKVTDKGKAKAEFSNAVAGLRHDASWEGVIGYNTFARCSEVMRPNHYDLPPGEWEDAHDLIVCEWLQCLGISITPQTAAAAVEAVARENKFNPVMDYLEGLEWDGVKRFDRWLTDYCGAEYNEYTSAVGMKWLIGAVARVYQPGCKMDNALVLEGPQGVGKSAVFKVMGGKWFTDDMPQMHGKNAAESVGGVWVMEIAELSAMQKSDIESVKAFITRQVDRFRPAYGRRVAEYPRTSIFGGTCNGDQWLRDDENRRFWPVKTAEIMIDELKEVRDQLWAEAVLAYKNGANWYLEGEINTQAKREQETRRQGDIWEEIIARYIVESPYHDERGDTQWSERRVPLTKIGVTDILEGALNIPVGRWNRADQMRISACFKALGWVRKQQPDRSWKYEKVRDSQVKMFE